MNNRWQDKRALIIGAARQGQALARYLSIQGARITLNDKTSMEELSSARQALSDLPITWVCGSHPLELLDNIDVVFVSGGIPLTLPLIQETLQRGLPLSNDTQVFMEICPCPMIGITGSAGKTTTTTLVGRIAQAGLPGSRRVWIGGNIGFPLIARLGK